MGSIVTTPGAPASLLARAAEKMREDADRCGDPPGSFIPALAELLEVSASCGCEAGDDHWAEKAAVLRIARAYLGEAQESPRDYPLTVRRSREAGRG